MKSSCGDPPGIVLGISGKIASGKTTLAKSLSYSLKWPVTSFGDYVRSVAIKRGLESSERRVLQDIGLELLTDDAAAFCQSVLELGQFESGGNLLIDGIRHRIVIETLKKLVLPSSFKHIHVGAIDSQRARRLALEESALQVLGNHTVESEIDELIDIADLVLNGDNPVDMLTSSVLAWLAI
ncbi:MAG TPA: hypothetical protein EYN91_17005 [Candidatus Melainabacteria bacterium]|nr:hypothetical protein [Candidatus Melainabacteria bacterium]HIN64351.1 hypothetical protein [Candidatus Obscuribacterales bacterium]